MDVVSSYLLGHPFEYLIHLYGRGLSYLLGHPFEYLIHLYGRGLSHLLT